MLLEKLDQANYSHIYVCVSYVFGIDVFLTPFYCRATKLNATTVTFFCTCTQNLPHTASSVLSISVRNHAVHFVGQLVLEVSDGARGPACDEVRGGALHLVQAHVTGLGNLTLGEADKLGVPGEDAETLRDQNLKSKTWSRPKSTDGDSGLTCTFFFWIPSPKSIFSDS